MLYQAKNNKLPGNKNLKILNFYSDSCPPCHAFMPNFINAEKTFGKHYDFIAINSNNNIQIFQKYRVISTPTIIILDGENIIFNKSGIPNGQELKQILIKTAGIDEKDITKRKEKKKWFFGLF